MTSKSKVSAALFEQKFEAGQDIDSHLDWAKAKVVRPKTRRVKVEFPDSLLKSIDKEAARLGVTRDALIRFWLGQRLAKPAA
jgi:predicted DNA binding CopG/RHH family protein